MTETTDRPAPQVDPVTKVARDLTAIEDLACHLEAQAIHKANDREMPGGAAMVSLAGVANLEAWQNVVDTTLRLAYEYGEELPELDDEDGWEPPLQTLCFWSEQWRRELDAEYGQRPTISSEANFIRYSLNWAWENEAHWSDFADDIKKARSRLENVLYDGVRVERGVPCLYDECKGARLVRHIEDDGSRTDWRCPRCKREWNEDRYWAHVKAANERAQREEIGPETWCSVDYAARAVGRSPKTIRTWVNRGKVSTVCIVLGRRAKFVNLDEVRQRDEEARRRSQGAA